MVPFFKPPVGEEEAQAVAETVRSGWLTFGKKVEEFEAEFAKYINAPYCVMVDNCTAALFLAFEYSFQDTPRDQRNKYSIGVPSFTCAATALAPLHAGLKIKFIDLEEGDSFLMKEHLGFSVPVAYAGKYRQHQRTIVEDFAHRIERKCFTGSIQAYSFYVTKNLTTGEGGMIACSSKKESDWFKKARLYGNANAVYERSKMYSTGDSFWWFESEFQGWKANPTDIAASIGLVQLKKLDALNADRKRIAERYNEAFDLSTDRAPWHLYPILVNNRDKFMFYMKDNGVACSVHFPPLHMMKAFSEFKTSLPNTEYVYERIVSLPLYPYMTEEEQEYVIRLTLDWFKNNGRV